MLKDVEFHANVGEVTALVGDNGAGKSTLVKCIAGTYPFDSGVYEFEGRAVHLHSPRDASALGIEVVYQDLALCDNLDVVQNMFLGRERTSGIVLDESSMEQSAEETLKSLSVRTLKSVRQRVSSLSGGQRQTVAIAKAVLWNSKVVVLDEPTAALGVAQTAQVLDLVRRLADRGVAVVLISHNMIDVLQVADEIAIMYLGRSAARVAALGRQPAAAGRADHHRLAIRRELQRGGPGMTDLQKTETPAEEPSAVAEVGHAARSHHRADGRRRLRAQLRHARAWRRHGLASRRRRPHRARAVLPVRRVGLRLAEQLREHVPRGQRHDLHRYGSCLRPAARRDRPRGRLHRRHLRRR